MRKVLVVAAHPADEVLGCGGTIAAHCGAGDQVKTLILGEGLTARDTSRNIVKRASELAFLRQQAREAAGVLGQAEPVFLGLPDNRFDSVDLLDIVKEVEAIRQEFQPQVVYTHTPADLNIDNVLTSRATMTAFRPLPGHQLERVSFFEVPSSTDWGVGRGHDFRPNYFVDVSSTMAKKLKALEMYETEVQPAPHPRSGAMINSLAEYRGASTGVAMAEAFHCVWQLVRLSGSGK